VKAHRRVYTDGRSRRSSPPNVVHRQMVSRVSECWTLCPQDISPTRHFAYDMDTSPIGHFAYWTVRLQDISPTGHFAYSVDSSPTQCQHKRIKMRDIQYVPKTRAEQ